MKMTDLEQIVKILRENDVTEFELEHDGTHIRLSRGVSGQVMTSVGVAPRPSSVTVEPAVVAVNGHNGKGDISADAIPAHFMRVESPLVGTFYRKPSPDAEPFVREGDVIKKGDTLCIVEAMKLMNEIEAPCSGKVEKVCVSDSTVVEFGEVLFVINPTA